MSLAATLAADGMRPASFVPVVKCSHCEQEIEIASMGAHQCANMTSAPVSSSYGTYHDEPPKSPAQQHYSICNPYTLRSHQSVHGPSPLQYSQQPDEPMPPMPDWMQNRAPASEPPSLDAAPTLPLLSTDFLDPPSQSPGLSVVDERKSPTACARSAGGGGRSPFLQAKTPPLLPGLFDSRPPSESMSPNLDCAFPPFPTSGNTTNPIRKPSNHGRKTPANLNALPLRGSSRHGRGPVTNDDLRPNSPLPLGGENMLQRVDSPQTGAFDYGGPMSGDALRSKSGTEHHASVDMNAFGIHGLDAHDESMHDFDYERADSPPPVPPQPAHADELKNGPPSRPARPTSSDVLSPSFLRQLSDDSHNHSPELQLQSPPLPPKSPESINFTRLFASVREEGESPAGGLAHSPREESLAHQGTSVPARLLRQNSPHTPSQSGSSTTSSTHSAMHSNSTNATSPSGSATSSIDIFSPASYNRPTFGEDGKGSGFDGPRTFGDDGKGAGFRLPQEPGLRAEMPVRRSPPRNFARPSPAVPLKDFDLPGSPTVPTNEYQESPMDPALQVFSEIRNSPHEPAMRPPVTRTMTEPQSSRDLAEPTLPRLSYEPPPRLTIKTEPQSQLHGPSSLQDVGLPSPQTPAEVGKALPPPPPEPTEEPVNFPARRSSLRDPRRNRAKSNAGQGPPMHGQKPSLPTNRLVNPPPRFDSHGHGGAVQSPKPRPTTAGKSHCRGCHYIIEGKSVKDSEGRLTGRWHKSCFTCRTCDQAFSTADFYVFNDQPYCEHHYHEKNGSLCHGCNRGIEGQYLEALTMTRHGRIDQKYHPRCFTCVECREVLKDDYYEFRGRVFCERHALAAMRGQARPGGLAVPDSPSLRAERRTTRLMMMGPGSWTGLT